VVTVDWEGRVLSEDNIAAMEAFNARFPDVKLVQFLNAAYFTKPDANADDVRARIARALDDDDELGLHIHGWKRLFEAAGVTFRPTPTFWGTDQLTNDCNYDCGHEVPISAYDTEELQQVMRFSVETLDAAGFGRAVSFRAGGWMAAPNVQDALAAEGFVTENSAVPAEFLASEIGDLPLLDWVADLWNGMSSTSQPYVLETASGDLVEVPDNGALADYMLADEMTRVYDDCKRAWRDDEQSTVVLSIGFHQETAAKFLPRVEDALDAIFADANDDGVPIKPTTASRLATDR
jgi:hypothetical protein